jgi:sensor histidine kinase regulating citrate/malate metabolism
MIYIGKQNVDERNYSLMQKQVEIQKESIQALEQKYDETAKVRHDIKNYITVALTMTEQNKYAELQHFLEQLSNEKINSITTYINTKRSVMGAVLNSKLSKANKNNICMQCYILSEFESISDMDIGILLANLLDNAIEACEKNQKTSEITVKTWTEAGYYFLEICNTVESEVLVNNPQLESNKDDIELHGVGLRSVRDIVNKYDGMMSFNQKGNIFHVYVSLEKKSI